MLGLWVLFGSRVILKHSIHQTELYIIFLLLTLEITHLVAEQPCTLGLIKEDLFSGATKFKSTEHSVHSGWWSQKGSMEKVGNLYSFGTINFNLKLGFERQIEMSTQDFAKSSLEVWAYPEQWTGLKCWILNKLEVWADTTPVIQLYPGLPLSLSAWEHHCLTWHFRRNETHCMLYEQETLGPGVSPLFFRSTAREYLSLLVCEFNYWTSQEQPLKMIKHCLCVPHQLLSAFNTYSLHTTYMEWNKV